MFVGRTAELAALAKAYNSDRFEMVVLYGRRRVGKTSLLNEFARGNDAIYFAALESSGANNLASLSRAILEPELGGSPNLPTFASFDAALDYLHRKSLGHRTVLIIDEYPYLAAACPDFPSLLQHTIDHKFTHGKLMLVLCGSSMTFMEQEVLGDKSPLYGRRTAQIKLHPFTFAETAAYFPTLEPTDLAMIYGITGGVPRYLSLIQPDISVEANIKQQFLHPAGYLFEEAGTLLKQEVREAHRYNAVLSAIAQGATRHSEIADKVGLESPACNAYLKTLVGLGLVRKETPQGEKASRRTIYAIADTFSRFWYRFIPHTAALVANHLPDQAFSRIAPHLPAFMGAVFEEICRQHLWDLYRADKLPFHPTDIGRWWGNDPIKRAETEIDLVAFDSHSSALFAECKWTEAPVDTGVLETLLHRGRLFSHPRQYYYLFAKTDFTTHCRQFAAELGNVELITLAQIHDALRT